MDNGSLYDLPPDLPAEFALPLITRLLRIMDAYAGDLFVVYRMPVDAGYIRLRLELDLLLEKHPYEGFGLLALGSDALPASLGEFMDAAKAGIWPEYMRDSAFTLQSKVIEANLRSGVSAERVVLADRCLRALGWDAFIEEFERDAQQKTRAMARRLGLDTLPQRGSPTFDGVPTSTSASRGDQLPKNQRRARERARLARQMEQTGMTRKEIARNLGVDVRTVYLYLSRDE